MSRKRFRWSREAYRQAESLNRLLTRHVRTIWVAPPLVRHLQELWKRHPQKDDPLLILAKHRLEAKRWEDDDSIPF